MPSRHIKDIDSISIPSPEELNINNEEETIFADYIDDIPYEKTQEKFLLKEKAKSLKIENDNLKKLNSHRINYSNYILCFVVVFVGLTIVIITLSGNKTLSINDNVLITLLSTNMFQVVGILYIVTKWLYPKTDKL